MYWHVHVQTLGSVHHATGDAKSFDSLPRMNSTAQAGTTSIMQPSIKSFKIKTHMAKLRKQNRPLPQWFRMKTGNTIRYVVTFQRETGLVYEVCSYISAGNRLGLWCMYHPVCSYIPT